MSNCAIKRPRLAPKRGSQRHLLPPGYSFRQHQVRHIRAGDEQHHQNRSKREVDRAAQGIANQQLRERIHREAPVLLVNHRIRDWLSKRSSWRAPARESLRRADARWRAASAGRDSVDPARRSAASRTRASSRSKLPAGKTPMILCGSPSSTRSRFRTSGSPPNRVCQNAWLKHHHRRRSRLIFPRCEGPPDLRPSRRTP